MTIQLRGAKVRVDLNRIEKLSAIPFVLLAGATGGLLQAIAEVTQHHAAISIGGRLLAFAVAVTALWTGVRRRRYSVWGIALQLSLAAILANLITLSIVIATMLPAETHLEWRDVAMKVASGQLGQGAGWFLIGAGLVALGRSLTDSGQLAPSEHPDGIT
jgi:hypothetical protein